MGGRFNRIEKYSVNLIKKYKFQCYAYASRKAFDSKSFVCIYIYKNTIRVLYIYARFWRIITRSLARLCFVFVSCLFRSELGAVGQRQRHDSHLYNVISCYFFLYSIHFIFNI